MPRGDQTGPMGQGPMTGRGAGKCAGHAGHGAGRGFKYGYGGGAKHGFGHGFGRGLGHGRMFCHAAHPHHGYHGFDGASYSAADEKATLTYHAQLLRNRLEEIENRLAELDETN